MDAGTAVLRELALQYLEVATSPEQARRRALWSRHNSLQKTTSPVLLCFGMWNAWCQKDYSADTLACEHPLLRQYEWFFKIRLLQWQMGDDDVFEPWITLDASRDPRWGWNNPYGDAMSFVQQKSAMSGGASKHRAVLTDWKDMDKLEAAPHRIDEEATRRRLGIVQDALGDLIDIDVRRTPLYHVWRADLATNLAELRGMEQIMIDVYEEPEELHRLLAFMRDAVLANQQEAEDAGDYSLTSAENQGCSYAEDLEALKPNCPGKKRKEIWGHMAAQEYTLISPEMHDEFLLQYQLPIIEKFGPIKYGCCEDLTRKIDLLRKIPNLRTIAVAPSADVGRCVEQIGRDYVIAWHPNPTDMVASQNADESRIRKIIREELGKLKGSCFHVLLKDIETVCGEPLRMKRWVEIVREELASL